ncbi:MAG: hypothetical protein OHK0022_49070 [Roseiflexaceae bacterium]
MADAEAFGTLLTRFMAAESRSAADLATLTAKPDPTRAIPKRTIENWRKGENLPRGRDGCQRLLWLATKLRLSADDATSLLQAAGFQPIPVLIAQAQQTSDDAMLAALACWIELRASSGKTSEVGPLQSLLQALLHDHTGFMQDRLASFVGRADELAEVQRRIAELLPTGGYVTITGQAGQGKSSLIVKLVEGALRERVGEDLPIAQLVERAGPFSLAYHFIPFQPGPDHQVGLLRNLMARLIGKYGLSELYVATDSRSALRDYFARVLIEVAGKGGQEVIYLDGLDQIEEDASGVRDLSFLPTNPPAGIVFVLGTRPNDTLRPLELRKPHATYWLPPLSRSDFSLILQHRGVALDLHLADRFYTVMEANALYLDLVARELAQAGALPPEQIIAQVADNPENLFSLAVERLKRPPLAWREVIKPVLGLLLAAREPLRLRAIRTLISQPEDAVQEGLERLGGLLQRDGEGRYTLFHLKLRDYLREDTAQPGKRYVFAADEEEQWHARLAVWAEEGGGLAAIWQDTVGNALEQDRRAYARQHYVTHLCLAKQWPRLWAVLDAGEYAAAKLRHDPSTRSVVLDLDLVRQQMVVFTQGDFDTGLQWLPLLWRYSLLRGNLASQADNYPDGLIPLLAELGWVQEAIGLAEVLTDTAKKAVTMVQIGHVLVRQNQAGVSKQTYQRASEVAQLIEDGRRRAKAMGEVAAALAAGGEQEQALQMARSIEDGGKRAEALGKLVGVLVVVGEREQALQVARSIEDGRLRAEAMGEVAAALAADGEREQALQVARSIEDERLRARAMGKLVVAHLKSRKREWALVLARLIKSGWRRAQAVRKVAAALAADGEREQALQVARSIEDERLRAEALGDVAAALAAGGEREQALQVARSIEDERLCAKALGRVAAALVADGEREQALQVTRSIKNGGWRAEALGNVAAALVAGGEVELARICVTEALAATRSIEDGGWRDEALGKLAAALVEGGEREQGLTVTRLIKNGERRAEVLWEVVAALVVGGEREQALQVARSIEDERLRDQALMWVTTGLVAGRERERALTVARSIEDERLRDEALGKVAAALVAGGECERALTVARSIEDARWRDQALREVATALVAGGERGQALVITRLIENARWRDQALREVAAALLKSGKREWALVAARLIEDGRLRDEVLGEVAAVLVASGERERALTVAWSIKDARWRGEALRQMVAGLVADGEREQALQMAQSIEDARWRAEALGQVAAALVADGEREQAMVMARSIEDEVGRVQVLGQVAAALVAAGEREQAMTVARSIEDGRSRDEVLGEVAAALVKGGELEHMLEVVQLIEDEQRRVRALIWAAVLFMEDGQENSAYIVAAETFRTIMFNNFSTRFAQIISLLNQIRDSALVLAFLRDHWPVLTRRDQIIALLPAATPLIAAHPPLLQELLDGFAWVDQVLTKW